MFQLFLACTYQNDLIHHVMTSPQRKFLKLFRVVSNISMPNFTNIKPLSQNVPGSGIRPSGVSKPSKGWIFFRDNLILTL